MKRLSLTTLLMLALGGCQGPYIASGYGSYVNVGGGTRDAAHAGIDYPDAHGAPVLAAADGLVDEQTLSGGCGFGVVLKHEQLGKNPNSNHNIMYTVYCHLSKFAITADVYKQVKRGDVIGFVGATGNSMDIPHVHFEVTSQGMSHKSGDLEGTEDPAKYLVGCFDPKKTFPLDRLTHPVACKDK